ncbi:MAG: sialate O-acetylesterase [Planctomycetota bacterium]|jgi:sialate O-acetylesterase
MKIYHGLMDGQVLKRNAKNRGGAVINGSSKPGTVEARILKGKTTLRGQDWKAVGTTEGKTFLANLSGIPTGGPYTVELRVKNGRKVVDTLSIDEIFVGDVWILAGQSNMQGCGNRVDAPKPDPRVRAFYMRDEWSMADEPIHLLSEAVDTVHNGYGLGKGRPTKKELQDQHKNHLKGVGPGVSFALDMVKRTRVPQGLIACAHGGTSMAQWDPDLLDKGGASLYGAMIRRYAKLGQPVAGVLWYQGESDANEEAAKVYTEKMIKLVEATRRDMKLPALPWLVVQIGCHIAGGGEWWNSIQEQERCLPEVIKHLDVAPTIDLQLDDGIHIGGKGQAILGKRLARLADRLVHRNRKAMPGISLKSVDIGLKAPFPGVQPVPTIEVSYSNVAGKLESQGLPHGFALVNDCGEKIDAIYKTTLRGSKVVLEVSGPMPTIAGGSLSYGHGRYSACTITDSEGMSLPVMKAVPLDTNISRFANKWQVAQISKGGSLSKISARAAAGAKGWGKAPMEQGFLALPRPLDRKRTGLFAFRTTLTASEALKAVLKFGADSPFIAWLNGTKVKADLKATNPATPDQYKMKIALKQGENELVVAFDPRDGAGWGICARIESPSGKPLTETLKY